MRAPHCTHWQMNDGVGGIATSSTRGHASTSPNAKPGTCRRYTRVALEVIILLAGQIKGDDPAGTIFERLAITDDPTDYKENVIGAVSLTGDYVVAVDTKGTPLKRGKSALQSFVGTERFKKFYRGIDSAKNLVAIWRDKRRLAEIKVDRCYARWCCADPVFSQKF